MKRFYLRFRIMLMTFALGLASVFIINGSLKYSTEIFVDVPSVQSDSPITIFPGNPTPKWKIGHNCTKFFIDDSVVKKKAKKLKK